MGLLLTFTGLLALLAGYLLGSIPFGLVLTKAAGLGDVRQIGSGNIGATNVLRTGNKGLAAATLLLDTLKGTVAVLMVYHLALWLGSPVGSAGDYSRIAGLGALLGHVFPVWLRFQGGKGVATFIGVLIGIFLEGRSLFRADLARGGSRHPLLLARGAVRHGRGGALLCRHRLGRTARHRCHGRPDLPQAPREHPSSARRPGGQDWGAVVTDLPSRRRRPLPWGRRVYPWAHP